MYLNKHLKKNHTLYTINYLFKHDYAITDMPKHVKKIRKMLSVKNIRDTFSFDQKRIQWIVTCYNS